MSVSVGVTAVEVSVAVTPPSASENWEKGEVDRKDWTCPSPWLKAFW